MKTKLSLNLLLSLVSFVILGTSSAQAQAPKANLPETFNIGQIQESLKDFLNIAKADGEKSKRSNVDLIDIVHINNESVNLKLKF